MQEMDSDYLWFRLNHWEDRKAISGPSGALTYGQVYRESVRVNEALQGEFGFEPGQKVALLCSADRGFVKAMLGVWMAGGVVVPLHTAHPEEQWNYFLHDSGASHLLYDVQRMDQAHRLAAKHKLRLIRMDDKLPSYPNQRIPRALHPESEALILYTSGTTSQPKGAVLSIRALHAQMEAMSKAWQWAFHDYVLHVLPLHHTHGLINVLCTALWNGAHCEMMPFDAALVWKRFSEGNLKVFMAVPTMYHKLVEYWEAQSGAWQDHAMAGVEKMRLMVSGSAALPEALFKKWYAITGHALLERYGMTEIGMALSNPYAGERRPGTVGTPMPEVAIRLRKDEQLLTKEGEQGGIEVKSPQLFSYYQGKPEETKNSFTTDGWFITGDVGVLERGYYRILGRSSIDIIKSGGYKISALEIEAALLDHPEVKECAVFALPDEIWGETIAVVAVLKDLKIGKEQLKSFLQAKLPGYKIPTRWYFRDELPRNAMGKVTKASLPSFLGI